MANTEARRGDVEVALDEFRNTYVSPEMPLQDGSALILHGVGLVAKKIDAINPVLPDFVTQSETVIEPESFKAYIQAFKGDTAICRASLGKNQIEALLDYHGPARMGDRVTAQPNRLAHRVTLQCPFDIDYAKWRVIFGEPMGQGAFGEVLEDMVHTISEPAVADLQEAIDELRIDRAVRFKSKVDRRGGTAKFTYEEEDSDDANAGGTVSLPQEVKIVVSIFQGGPAIELVAKLRYRMDKGKVAFILVVPGLDKIERDQFRRIGEDVRSSTGTPVFYTA